MHRYCVGMGACVVFILSIMNSALAIDHAFYLPWFHTAGYEIRSLGCPVISLDADRYHKGVLAASMESFRMFGVFPWIMDNAVEHCLPLPSVDSVEFSYYYGFPHIAILFGMRPFWGGGLRLSAEDGMLTSSILVFVSLINRKWYMPFNTLVRIGVGISTNMHTTLFWSVSYWHE